MAAGVLTPVNSAVGKRRAWPTTATLQTLERIMAKKKTTVAPAPADPASPMTPEQFRKIAEPFVPAIKGGDRPKQLKAIYALGKLLIEHVPKHSSYGDKQVSKYAKALGCSSGRLSMIRRFAAMYTQAEFDELLKTSLSFGHVGLLLSLKGAERPKFQAEAAKKKWTVAQLQLGMKQRPNVVRRGGQPMKVADDLETALHQLVAEGETWKQRCDMTANLIAGKAKIPAKLREQAKETADELQAMAKAVQGVAKTLAALE